MPATDPRPTTPPPAVWTVALVLTFFAAWQLVTRAVPAFAAGDPEAFSAAIGVMVLAAIVWGLLRLRPWARSFALFISGFGVVVAAAAMGLLQQPDLAATVAAEGYDTALLARMLTVLGALGALSVVLLRTASARRAFGLGWSGG